MWDGLGQAIMSFIIFCVVAAFGVGMLAMWWLPKLWEIVKPWIHATTS